MSDNSWYEKGELPPVGIKVQYSCRAAAEGKSIVPYCWYAGTIIAYHDGYVWTSDNGIRPLNNTVFRPIKTERELAIEAAAKVMSMHGIDTYSILAEKLFDAGLLRSKNES